MPTGWLSGGGYADNVQLWLGSKGGCGCVTGKASADGECALPQGAGQLVRCMLHSTFRLVLSLRLAAC